MELSVCGKYLIGFHEYGREDGIPRFLDMGRCNDGYGAIQAALALAEAFNRGVNDLPLTPAILWSEQEAVAVLTTLLYLSVQDITLDPALPVSIAPDVRVEKYGLKGIGENAEGDAHTAMEMAIA